MTYDLNYCVKCKSSPCKCPKFPKTDLIFRLRELAKNRYKDVSVADEAAELIEGIANLLDEPDDIKSCLLGISELLTMYGVDDERF